MRPWSPPLHSQEGSLAEWAQDLLAKIPWVEQSSTTCMELEVCRVAAQRSGKDTDTQEGSLGFVGLPAIPTPPGNTLELLWESMCPLSFARHLGRRRNQP